MIQARRTDEYSLSDIEYYAKEDFNEWMGMLLDEEWDDFENIDINFIDPSSWPKLVDLIEDAPELIESDEPDPEPLF